MKYIALTVLGLFALLPVMAQRQTEPTVEKKLGPQYQKQRMKLERLNRGVVAVRNGQQVVVSWRTLSTDRTDEPFDVYRNGVKLNSKPLTKGGSFFVDEQPLAADATYEVRGGGQDGRFVLKADAGDGYVAVPLQKPAMPPT